MARRVEAGFVDLDEIIEKEAQMPISKIFRKQGEAGFRRLEKLALRSIPLENVVVATGGGTPCFFDNAEWMNARGLTVWLMAHDNTIAQRIAEGPQVRPLLHDLKEDEAREKIKTLLESRESFYELAKLHLPAENLKPAGLFEAILRHGKDNITQ